MFEKIKGVSKGGKVSELVSKSTLETINSLINENIEIKTNDTLFTCRAYYFYAKTVAHTTNFSANKFINFIGALDMQAKNLLKEWLQTYTGIFALEDYIGNFDNEYEKFLGEMKNKYGSLEGNSEQKLNSFKTTALEITILNLKEYFKNIHGIDSGKFELLITSCCQNIRVNL